MEHIAILYSTVDGHTRTLCARLQQRIEAAGHRAECASIEDTSHPLHQRLAQCDRILIGASVRHGLHRAALYRFIDSHHATLQTRPGAFFSVNLVARKAGKDTPEGNPYIRQFRRRSRWQPALLGVFAGQLDYTRYGLLDRSAIRFIMWLTHGPTSASGAIVYTDWQQLDAFGQALLALPLQRNCPVRAGTMPQSMRAQEF